MVLKFARPKARVWDGHNTCNDWTAGFGWIPRESRHDLGDWEILRNGMCECSRRSITVEFSVWSLWSWLFGCRHLITMTQKCIAVPHPCSNHAAQQNAGEESDSEKERRIGLNFGRSSAIAICCQHATRSMSSQKAFSPPPNPSVWLPCDFGTRTSSRLLWEYIRSRKHGSTNSVPSVWTHV